MKNLILTFFLPLAICTPLFCQSEFAPVGAEWSYSYKTYWTSFDGFMVVKSEKDTVISNYAVKKLHLSILDSSLVEQSTLDYFIRQSADSIFTVFAGSDISFFLFKTQYQLNETAEFDFLWSYPLTVSAIDTLNFGGQTTKKYVLDSDHWLFDQTVVYEKFGPELGYFQSWWGVQVDGDSYKLLCYQDDEFPPSAVGNGPCFGLTSTNEKAQQPVVLSVFPNPASTEITVDFHGEKAVSGLLTVWDISGKTSIQKAFSGSQSLDISALPSGMYFGNVADGVGVFPFKFIKL